MPIPRYATIEQDCGSAQHGTILPRVIEKTLTTAQRNTAFPSREILQNGEAIHEIIQLPVRMLR